MYIHYVQTIKGVNRKKIFFIFEFEILKGIKFAKYFLVQTIYWF